MLPSTISLLKKYAIRPQKRLGQNFLTPTPTLQKIVASLEPHQEDIIVEIGSGLGVMTAMLAERCQRVIAVEKDPRLLDIARMEFAHLKNIEWIEDDFLHYKLPARSKVIGNIPYEITSPILFKLVDHASQLDAAILLMQREVALRITARPNTKDYGILSVCLQTAAHCQKLFDVSAKSFIPQPEVMSSVVRFDFVSSLSPWFRSVVRAAFGQRRKMLRNALLGSQLEFTTEQLDRALAACGVDGQRRPETLSIEEYAALTNALDKAKSALL